MNIFNPMKHWARTTAMVAAWICATTMMATPAKWNPFTVTNSDGTTLTLVLRGDENYHFYTTTEGVPVLQLDNGDWRLAPELADSIAETWTRRSQRKHFRRNQPTLDTRTQIGVRQTFTGSRKGLVILLNFKNLNMKSTSTQQKWSRQFNEEGYDENGHIGSVHDYFYDQSYGKFDLTFDVVGPVKVSNDYGYYGQNDKDGDDSHVAELAAEVCRLADQNYDIRWSDYDWDNDGEVDQVVIIYAGYGESSGAPANTIWPHEWSLTEGASYGDGKGPITLGGRTIDSYAACCELSGTIGSRMDAIGTACHEFAHCLGLPDFYDTSYSGGFGMDAWDLMGAGSYNGARNDGEIPAGFTAYERWFAGWLDFTELTEPCTVADMPDLQDEPVAYLIHNDNNHDEYFTLENRQAVRWNQYVYSTDNCHGMLVCHVDYDKKAWEQNTPNNEAKHQRMTIIPAGGEYGTLTGSKGNQAYYVSDSQYRSQLFPGSKNVTELTDESHNDYGGKLYNRNTDATYLMHKPITNIVETDGLLSFDFMGGGAPISIGSIPTDAHSDTPSTVYYTLEGIPVAPPTARGIYIIRQGTQTRKVAIP